MTKSRPLILVTNDDGIEAAGVHRLIDFLADMADIVCLCPDSPRSGGSMALTVKGGLRITDHGLYNGAAMYSTNGTPTDCVKLAWHTILRDRRPDLVVSGINHGSNAAINVLYSGTMGAAQEGCAFGVPSVGFSLTDHSPRADFDACEPFVQAIVAGMLKNPLPSGICLNVNIPHDTTPAYMQICRECKGNWSDEYVEYTDPHGHKFYMLAGKFDNAEPQATDTDEYALHHGIVSIVPVMLERTAAMNLYGIDYNKRAEQLEQKLSWLRELCSHSFTR